MKIYKNAKKMYGKVKKAYVKAKPIRKELIGNAQRISSNINYYLTH